jgi:hypothetical protein
MNVGEALNIDVSEEVHIAGQDMSLYKAARWLCLIKGIDIIDRKAKQLKIDLRTDKSWVKPLALQKYINEETPSMVTEVKVNTSQDSNQQCTIS